MICKLKDLLTIKNGADHKNIPDGNIPVYGSGGIMRYCNKAIYDKPSILLPRKGTLDNIQYVDRPFWTVDTAYYTEIDTNKAEPYYLYRYLRLLDLSRLNSGTGVPSMTFDSYYNIPINLPPLPTQQKIAGVLSSLDAKIALNARINANLERIAKRLYDYWFVQFDFPRSVGAEPCLHELCRTDDGKPRSDFSNEEGKPYKSSGGKMVWSEELKREIPEGWKVKRLGDVCDIYNGSTPSTADEKNYGGDIIWITPKDLSDQKSKFIYQGAKNITKKGYNSCSTTFVPNGTILMSSRAPIGLVSIATCELCTNQGFKNLVPKNKKYTNLLYYTLLSNIPQIQNLGTGTTFKEVSKDKLSNFSVLYPTEDFIDSFTQKTLSIFNYQLSIQQESQKLSSLRDKLLPLLMNGQVNIA